MYFQLELGFKGAAALAAFPPEWTAFGAANDLGVPSLSAMFAAFAPTPYGSRTVFCNCPKSLTCRLFIQLHEDNDDMLPAEALSSGSFMSYQDKLHEMVAVLRSSRDGRMYR